MNSELYWGIGIASGVVHYTMVLLPVVVYLMHRARFFVEDKEFNLSFGVVSRRWTTPACPAIMEDDFGFHLVTHLVTLIFVVILWPVWVVFIVSIATMYTIRWCKRRAKVSW